RLPGAGADPSARLAAGRRADRQPRPQDGPRGRPTAARPAPRTADHPRRRDAQRRAGRPAAAHPADGGRRPRARRAAGHAGRALTMSLFRLRLESLLYHWRGNVAVFLGVAVGTAVLTGALLVGDALRGSLRDLTLRRLGWVDQALVGPRFVRQELADG